MWVVQWNTGPGLASGPDERFYDIIHAWERAVDTINSKNHSQLYWADCYQITGTGSVHVFNVDVAGKSEEQLVVCMYTDWRPPGWIGWNRKVQRRLGQIVEEGRMLRVERPYRPW